MNDKDKQKTKSKVINTTTNTNNNSDILLLIERKITFFLDTIQRTILHVQKNKLLNAIGVSEMNNCINTLVALSKTIKEITVDQITTNTDNIINVLQHINNEMSTLFKVVGTDLFEDFLWICFGNNSVNTYAISDMDRHKFELLRKYFHPTSYRILNTVDINSEKKTENKKHASNDENVLTETSRNLDSVDINTKTKSFHLKVYGIQVVVHNPQHKKSLVITGTVDDVITDILHNRFVSLKMKSIAENTPNSSEFKGDTFNRYISSLGLKEFIIYEPHEIYSKYAGYLSNLNNIKQKPIAQIVKDFISSDLFTKRLTIIQLLIKSDKYDNQYLAYLLYDLLSNDANGAVDTQEQTVLFDSLPWQIKQCFRNAMKNTVQYTHDLSNFDINKIPLEQQICLLKAPDTVKEKAMQKLKEVKAKSEDTGSKARQFLDGLLKIPFSVYRKEPILCIMDTIRTQFMELIQTPSITNDTTNVIPGKKDKYTSLEILKCLNKIKTNNNSKSGQKEQSLITSTIKQIVDDCDKSGLVTYIMKINEMIVKHKMNVPGLKYSNKKKATMVEDIHNFIDDAISLKNESVLLEIFKVQQPVVTTNNSIVSQMNKIETKYNEINSYMMGVKETLDNAVHGHDKAKAQVERIIGQWINGQQDGYCFGFEGPPGIGKCFAKNTPIMLSNGEIKMVQDITLNDKLMGDDSKERNVLALGNGIEKMYRIEQVKGDNYIVNESHILSLKMSKSGKKEDKHQTILGKKYFKNDIVDICIKDYLGLPKYIKECLKGYKVGVEFSESYIDLDPYALGCWLGDGTSRNFSITTIDEPILKYFREFAKINNLCFKQGTGSHKITYSLTSGKMGGKYDKNILINKLKGYNLINNKHIPNSYKCNSREVRLQLLAGLIDTDGYYYNYNNSLEIIQKNKILADDILWLVRSLGFRGTMKECTKSCIYKGERKYGQYYKTIISGKGLQDIPTLLERKKPREYKQIKDCLNTGINVVPLEEDEYFGFQIDGNSRFLLGDFTVTHNTSLAKRGLSDCLKDENGVPRPFAMIQMGGDANGSSIHGHNYTYVGSTWGSIVQILMDKKCMNPIIFIDEIDKISKTEHGKEIVGILTHLLDPAQNDCFQDKYFSGIDLDLSKALFILSYNDVDAIDRILLDRVHRIKFNNLTTDEKLTICNKHILPEVYKKMGLEGMIHLNNDTLKHVIESYTAESGVRKLKEILFEIVGEINLDILKNFDTKYEIPIDITIDSIKTKYFKDKHELKIKKIHAEPNVGIMNGLWANALGMGGIIPIQAKWRPGDKAMSLHLTGTQGDVMKESMNVALTLAYNLTPKHIQQTIQSGLHIHCPDGSTPKDGPSAGAAITATIYSLFNNMKIKNNIAITGEITLAGNITAIGGLDLKFLGGIRAGVKTFLFPKENEKDYNTFMEKYKDDELTKDIIFISVEDINDVLGMVFQ
jgi:ATP-dependent Lon protease